MAPTDIISGDDPTLAEAKRADTLLRDGEYDTAIDLYRKILPQRPDDRRAHLNAAALLTRSGWPEDGRALITEFFYRNPLGALSPNCPDTGLVLVIRGQQSVVPLIGKTGDGGSKARLRGGHFTLRFLLDKRDVARRVYTIVPVENADMSDLPPHCLLLNTIADPDLESASLEVLSRHLSKSDEVPVINHPDKVWMTARDRNYQRLRGMEGVTFPKTIRVTFKDADAAELRQTIADHGFDMPVILRMVGGQTGRHTHLLDGSEAITDVTRKPLNGDYFLIAFRQLLWRDEYFRKLRVFHIDGEFYPVVCHLDKTWNVHGGNRREIMRGNETLMDEEKRFLADWKAYVGPANTERLYALAGKTGLDFFGIDFTLDDEGDGGIFIFELNAAMRHSFSHAENFPYKRPYDEAISAAFRQMIVSRSGIDAAKHATETPNERGS